MCCDLRTQTIFIAIKTIVVSGPTFCHWMLSAIAAMNRDPFTDHVALRNYDYYNETSSATVHYETNYSIESSIVFVWSFSNLISGLLCLIGAVKRRKNLLIPHVIVIFLTVLGISVAAIFLLVSGSVLAAGGIAMMDNQTGPTAWLGLGFGIFFLIVLIPILIALGLHIYYLVIVYKYYTELLNSGVPNSNTTAVMVLNTTTSTFPAQNFQPNAYPSQVAYDNQQQNIINNGHQADPPPAYEFKEPSTFNNVTTSTQPYHVSKEHAYPSKPEGI